MTVHAKFKHDQKCRPRSVFGPPSSGQIDLTDPPKQTTAIRRDTKPRQTPSDSGRQRLIVDSATIDWIQTMDPMDELAVAYYLTLPRGRNPYLICLTTAEHLVKSGRITTQLGRIEASLESQNAPRRISSGTHRNAGTHCS